MRGIDRRPLLWLGLLAVDLALAPVLPEPHGAEKRRWRMHSHLRQPVDVFDFFLHRLPLALLALRLGCAAACRRSRGAQPAQV